MIYQKTVHSSGRRPNAYPCNTKVATTIVTEQVWLEAFFNPQAQINIPIFNRLYHKKKWRGETGVTPGHLFIYLWKGVLNYETPNQSGESGSGDLIYLPPGTERRFSGKGAITSRLHLDLNLNDQLIIFTKEPIHLKQVPQLSSVFQLLEENHLNREIQYSHLQQRALIASLASMFLNLKYARKNNTGKNLSPQKKQLIENYLQNHLIGEIRVADLADAAGLTLDYFSRVFHNTYNISPRRYIIQQRIQQASLLLIESKKSLKEITCHLGINDISLFCRQFRKQCGLTPTEFRKQAYIY